MQAVVFDEVLQYRADFPEPNASGDRIIVDVIQAGICETDLQLCRGYMCFRGILGHEFVGTARSGRFAGQRVVGEINCACGACELCRRGLPTHCSQRTVIGILNHHGAFADCLWVPEQNLHPVPDDISDDQAVFTEPVAAACRIPQQIDLTGNEFVVVLGDGRLGNLCAQVLQHHGCRVTLVGKHDFKLRLARAFGITAERTTDFSGRKCADLVVDCTGSPTGFTDAMSIVRPCGTIVLKTTVAAEQPLHLAPLVIDEIRVVASRCGPFDAALKLLQTDAVQVVPMISARYPLSEAAEAFRRAADKQTLKVLFNVQTGQESARRL
ncbi:MAG: alcohol dehydrogenase catalytic domain-containing protein [Planctomycetaceae bacterium]|nr:alcohol dehydrogenase catalytic domain-containing protein [Planctomycetaceae bacterium]